MNELNEQIDSILEVSLDEYYKASDLKGFKSRELTDKEKEALKPTANILKGKGISAQSLLDKAGVDKKLKKAILKALKDDFEEAGFNTLEETKRATISLERTIQILDDITDPVQKLKVRKALAVFLRKNKVKLDPDSTRKLKTGFSSRARPTGPGRPSLSAMEWAIGWYEDGEFLMDTGPLTSGMGLSDINLYSADEIRQKVESWPPGIQYKVLGVWYTPTSSDPNITGWRTLEDVRIFRDLVDSPTVSEGQEPTDDLVEIVIDLDELKQNKLDEGFLEMFGGWVEQILGSMFGGRTLPLSVKGSRRDVESFAKALKGEKSYLEAARQHGLDHPTTYKNKSKLQNAIKGFEKDTGIKWPFK